MHEDSEVKIPSFSEAFRVWAKIGFLSFGGPAGQIAMMHKELVEKRRWINEERFLHALNYCMILPGPEAQQLATYLGWLLHQWKGGLSAGLLFILPGYLAMMVLSVLYALSAKFTLIQALFWGLKTAVLAIVLEAVIRIGKRALASRVLIGMAILSFVAIHFFQVPFPLIIAISALVGLFFPASMRSKPATKTAEDKERKPILTVVEVLEKTGRLEHSKPSVRRAIFALCVWLAIWFVPLLALAYWQGRQSVLVQEGVFFSQTAVVTFGGAYAVLAYIAQQALANFGWLKPGEMLDGLGLAETTPGPLILVVQFVGFMGAYRQAGSLPPLMSGILGATVTVWATFAPCFLWIFLGAPYIESLRSSPRIAKALSAITAAVVGVILNLSIWFALHVLFREIRETTFGPLHLNVPVFSTVDIGACAVSLGAIVATFYYKMPMIWLLLLCSTIGVLIRTLL